MSTHIARRFGAIAITLAFLATAHSPAAATGQLPGTTSAAPLAAASFSDTASSMFAADIEWMVRAGITSGCGDGRFCPNAPVTRGQMASFLARALGLPASGRNYFWDDNGSMHEASINAIAAAGIGGGCAEGRFCPTRSVTRAQMASFLARALGQAAASGDFFWDDSGSVHQADINRLASSGVTGGCAAHRFCPSTTVTRGQMAAFMHRAFVPAARLAPLAPAPPPSSPTSSRPGSLLISPSTLMSLPTSGAAWDELVEESNDLGPIDLSDQDERDDVRLLARALVTVRTGGDVRSVHAALARVPGTEAGGRTLALGRNLVAVVLAADLTGYRDPAFVRWVRNVIRTELDGHTLIETHETRPNNWGTHAGASRIAADLYLGDTADLQRAATVFRGWLGERSAYAGFNYGELDWQANPSKPVGINPRGATKDGHSIDGVLPDDQRRSGGFTWPPPRENYVYEALQGALLQAELLTRAGYPAYSWGDSALARAYAWLHSQAAYPAEGDDTWQPHLVNYRYGTGYRTQYPARIGKSFGFTDWLYRR